MRFFFLFLLFLTFHRFIWASPLKDLSVTPYGFFWTSFNASSAGLLSFGKRTLIAPTEAADGSQAVDEKARYSVDTAQTRLGVQLTVGSKAEGAFEIDLIDFGAQAPTTSVVRVRRSVIKVQLDENIWFKLGKDMSLFNQHGPFTANPVGGNYRSGNSGFILDEAVLSGNVSFHEWSVGIGNFGRSFEELSSTGPGAYVPSLVSFPSVTWKHKMSLPQGALGWAVIGSAGARWSQVNPSAQDTSAWAAKVFAKTEQDLWTLIAEVYTGVNSNDLALLTLAESKQMNPSSNPVWAHLREWGGFLSWQWKVNQEKYYLGYGLAHILNPQDGLKEKSLVSNKCYRLGYKKTILTPGLEFFLEGAYYESEYLVQFNTQDTVTRSAALGMTGLWLSF
jgi:hypothetical protein